MSRSECRGLVCEEGSASLALWSPRVGPCGAGLPGRGPSRARPADPAGGLGEGPPLGARRGLGERAHPRVHGRGLGPWRGGAHACPVRARCARGFRGRLRWDWACRCPPPSRAVKHQLPRARDVATSLWTSRPQKTAGRGRVCVWACHTLPSHYCLTSCGVCPSGSAVSQNSFFLRLK